MKYTLRPRQEKAVEKMVDFVNSKAKKKAIFVYPTSFGKSIVIANVASKFPDRYFINVTNSKELLKQNYEKYISYGNEASLCSASLNSNDVSKVTFATIGTLIKHKEFFKGKDVVILDDECFPGDTPILTNEGLINIGNLYKLYTEGKELPQAKSFNEQMGEFEYKQILNVKNNGKKNTVKLNFYPATVIETTSNHKFLTVDGWKTATDLNYGDAIVTSFELNHKNSYKQLNDDQFDFIIGTSLGDGCLREDKCLKNTTRVSFTHGAKQEEYIKWKASLLNCEKSVSFVKDNGYSNKPAFRLNSKKFYFEDKYKDYKEQIKCLNYKSLAVLWMDDGCLSSENYGKLYSLHDNEELVNLLQEKIKSLGIKGTSVLNTKSSSTGKPLWYIGIKKDGINDLFEKCAKYMHKSMSYKVNLNYKYLVGTYEWDKKILNNVVIYKESSDCEGRGFVYDMEVEDNHNYIVSSKKTYISNKYSNSIEKRTTEGIVVHNCHSGSKVGSQLDKFLKYIKTGKLIGTTATPFRLANSQGGSILKMMNRDRDCIYTSIEDVVQIHEVVEEKGWSPLVYLTKDVDESSLVLNTTGSDYTLESIKKFNQDNEIVENCILEAESLILQGRKSILISVPFIEDALQIEQRLSGCKAVYSGMNDLDRDNIISDFKSLKIKVVVQVMILSIGFDHPMLDALILAKPTNSLTFYYQFIGRGVRIHPDKKDCLIVDISGNYNKFGKVEDITIEENDYTKGWASFSGDTLLTSYPLGNKLRPTKKSLIRALEREIEQKENKKLALDPEFFFGKYKGKKLSEVIKDRDGKYYLAWIVEPETNFTFYGEKGSILKKAIYDELKLDSEPDVKPKPIQVNKQTYFSGAVRTHKEIISDYTSKISVAELWDSN